MSKTTLTWWTASVLGLLSAALMLGRWHVLGEEVRMPSLAETWKLTLIVQGRGSASTQVTTVLPLVTPQQQIVQEAFHAPQFIGRAEERSTPLRRTVLWTAQPTYSGGTFRLHAECYLLLRPRPEGAGLGAAQTPPHAGEYLRQEPGIEVDDPDLAACARELVAEASTPSDQVERLYRFVDEQIANEPSVSTGSASALLCLQQEAGDSLAKSRLLVALCRTRGIPARLVLGVTLHAGNEQKAHIWAEAFVGDHWLPMDAFLHHWGRLPRSHVVLAHNDVRVAHGRSVRGLESAFLMEKVPSFGSESASWIQRLYRAASPQRLPPQDRGLVEFLLLLPLASLLVAVFRNVIGMPTFGTFAPALLGLAFRETGSIIGMGIFVGILLLGWSMRKVLNRFHLLQVPRTAVMLSLIVAVLVGLVLVAHQGQISASRYLSLYPLVILTGMIERFWTLEEEDGSAASFRTLGATLGLAAILWGVLSWSWVSATLLAYPEALGVVVALLLLLGRYTGYRLTELYRFREFLSEPQTQPPTPTQPVGVIVGECTPTLQRRF